MNGTMHRTGRRHVVAVPMGHAAAVGLTLLLLAGAACRRADSTAERAPELILYCGAGIRPAADKLIAAFEKQHTARIVATYAGSGRLLGQLTASRTGDLFMPGSAFYVTQAIDNGLADGGTARDVAHFIPTILVRKGNPFGVTGLADFATMPLRVGLGDERAVAVGKQAVKLFEKNGIPYEDVLRQTVFKSGTVNELGVAVEMGTVDAVIVWDATARQFALAGDAVVIPEKDNIVTTIPIVQLAFSRHGAEALAFIDFVVSDAGRQIMQTEGYTVGRD